jgi:hypothetical protein
MGLPFGHPERMVSLSEDLALDITVVNYGKWIKEVSPHSFMIFND